MKSPRLALIISMLLLAVSAGCASYDPPVRGDHTSEKYKTDLEKCRADSTESVRLKNAATPGLWGDILTIRLPSVRAAIRACMAGKGYTLEQTGD